MKIRQYIMTAAVIFAAAMVSASCTTDWKFGENYGAINVPSAEDSVGWTDINAQYTFDHPCAMYDEADFTRVKTMLDNGTAPQAVQDAFEALKANKYALASYTATTVEYMKRGTSNDVDDKADEDAAAAYQTAMLWKLTGDSKYAEASIAILNAWANDCKGFDPSGNANIMLTAGIQGYTFANAGEIMQTYDGWSSSAKTKFKDWMVSTFATNNRQFMDYHWSTQYRMCDDHYWSNWDLVNMASYLSIGILTENSEMVNYVVNYFYNGAGNGCIKKLTRGTFSDPLGSGEQISANQESGRDQGHSLMSTMVTVNLCQIAYTLSKHNASVPELDFFAANDNAVLRMAEYVAICNLRDGSDNSNTDGSWVLGNATMPFNEYRYCMDCNESTKSNHQEIQTEVNLSDELSNGRGNVRPGWELVYMHYAKIKGLTSGYKYAKQFADKLRPECGAGDSRYSSRGGTYDQLGWGTLMMYRE